MEDVLAWANVFFGLLVFYLGVDYYRKSGKSWKSIKLLFGLVGLYWAITYLLILFTPESVWRAAWFSRGVVRGGMTGSLIVLASGALYRKKYGG